MVSPGTPSFSNGAVLFPREKFHVVRLGLSALKTILAIRKVVERARRTLPVPALRLNRLPPLVRTARPPLISTDTLPWAKIISGEHCHVVRPGSLTLEALLATREVVEHTRRALPVPTLALYRRPLPLSVVTPSPAVRVSPATLEATASSHVGFCGLAPWTGVARGEDVVPAFRAVPEGIHIGFRQKRGGIRRPLNNFVDGSLVLYII